MRPLMRKVIVTILTVLMLSACSHLPNVPNVVSGVVYRPPVQQGNIISSKTVAQLSSGMSQDQVLQLLGEPVLRDPYNDNRWFYVYSYVNNRSRLTSQKRLTLYFHNGILQTYTSSLDGKANASEERVIMKSPAPKKAVKTNVSTPADGPSSNMPQISLPVPNDLMH